MIETVIETIGNGDKWKPTHPQTKRMGICVTCVPDYMSSGVNAKELTQLQCASDRKDSQMLLRNIRESKTSFFVVAIAIYKVLLYNVLF